MRSKAEFVQLFRLLGVKDPEQWADAEVKEDLGNLPRVAFLHQAWKEIPGSNDVGWFRNWMAAASRKSGNADVVGAYDRLLASGAVDQDLISVLRSVMAQFLFRIAYLLDDPSLESEPLQNAVQWGFYEESDKGDPIRRLGCLHELVLCIDPEYKDG